MDSHACGVSALAAARARARVGRGCLIDHAGVLRVEVGREPLSVMSPGWEYHKGRTFPVWEEVTAQ